MHGAARVQ